MTRDVRGNELFPGDLVTHLWLGDGRPGIIVGVMSDTSRYVYVLWSASRKVQDHNVTHLTRVTT